MLTKQESEAEAVISMAKELEYWKKAFKLMRKMACEVNTKYKIVVPVLIPSGFKVVEGSAAIDEMFKQRMK